MKKKEIKIKELNLWDENPRFPEEYFNMPEHELIEFLFKKKGEKEKIIDLAKSIIKNFHIVPWERLIVYKHQEDFIVLEGNRRLAVYKLLLNPELLSASEDTYKIFSEGKKSTKIDDNFSVECLLTENREAGLRYVELKHLEAGYKGWGEPERNNFQRRRGKGGDDLIIKTEVGSIVKTLDIPREIKDKILGHGFVTTFYRIVSSSPAKDYFGYELKDEGMLNINDKKFVDKLRLIIWNVINKRTYREIFNDQKKGDRDRLNSRTLNTNENIKKYLDSLSSEDIEIAKAEIKDALIVKEDLFGGTMKEVQIKGGIIRKTPITKSKDIIFGRKISLKTGPVNDLYRAIDLIYEQNKHGENSNVIFPILGMSLRLILDVAARVHYGEIPGATKSEKDSIYKNFLDKAKKQMSKKEENFLSLTSDWISGKHSMDGMLSKYAHGNIATNKNDIMSSSIIIADILEFYFKK